MGVVGSAWCSGIVPLALLVIILITIKNITILFNLKNKESEETMETMKNAKITLKTWLNSFCETIWAIGTSTASAGVLHINKK